jgi:hypothetical protein
MMNALGKSMKTSKRIDDCPETDAKPKPFTKAEAKAWVRSLEAALRGKVKESKGDE